MDEIMDAQHICNEAGTFPSFSMEVQEALDYRKRFRALEDR